MKPTAQHSYRWPYTTLLLGAVLALSCPASALAADPPDSATAKRQIDAVKSQIDTLNQTIRTDQGKKVGEQKAIGALDREIAKASAEVRKLQTQIITTHEHLKTLEAKHSQINKDLADQRAAIASLVENSYRNGPQEPVKLVLNQQDPATLTRLMQYQRYSHEARQQKLAAFEASLTALETVKADTQKEIARLAELKRAVDRQQTQLAEKKQQRKQALAALDKKLAQQGGQLKTLRANQANLEAVLQRIQEAMARAARYENPTPVLKQRGNLPWPVAGRILRSFGSIREGDLRYEGVLLEASEGTPVRSVHNGRIVFSDWLRGYGMLIIVDHGNGFLSLYGNNQSLAHQPGESVAAGDVLAYSGSGGQNATGAYFEIRKGGQPVNPQEWCSHH